MEATTRNQVEVVSNPTSVLLANVIKLKRQKDARSADFRQMINTL